MLSSYRSGIIEADDTKFCSGNLNHAVTLVGYFPGETTETERRDVPRCRLRRQDEWPCENGEELFEHNWCCVEENRRVEYSDGAYWKIQNSWGKGMNDKGFIYVKVAEGEGWCGMNKEVHYLVPEL